MSKLLAALRIASAVFSFLVSIFEALFPWLFDNDE